MKRFFLLSISTACSISLSCLAKAQPSFAVAESESNNSFATREFLPSDTSTVDGQLSSEDLDFFTFSGLDAGSLFTAEITSDAFNPLLGLLDDSGSILAINDDKADDSVLSLITGTVPTNGNLNLAVSGLKDNSLTGDHFESGSYSLSLNTFTLPEPSINPTLINGGFETNDFTGWTTLGSTSIETAAFGSSPTEGTFEALLSTANITFADSILEAFLGLEAGSLNNLGNGISAQGSAIRQTFMAEAGDILTFDWNFLTNEVLIPPFNDFSFVSISSLSELADITFPSTIISPTTQFFQETDFQTFSFTIPTTGTYTLGLGVTDTIDNSIDSGLLIDNVKLHSVPEPTSVLSVLGFGALGAGSVLKRKQRQKAGQVKSSR
jgi:hypothetical protein